MRLPENQERHCTMQKPRGARSPCFWTANLSYLPFHSSYIVNAQAREWYQSSHLTCRKKAHNCISQNVQLFKKKSFKYEVKSQLLFRTWQTNWNTWSNLFYKTWPTPTVLSDKLKYPFINTTIYVLQLYLILLLVLSSISPLLFGDLFNFLLKKKKSYKKTKTTILSQSQIHSLGAKNNGSYEKNNWV